MANFTGFVLFAAVGIQRAFSGSIFFAVLSVSFVLGVARTGYVMLCVAQGKTGVTASGDPIHDIRDAPSQRPRLW